MNPTNYSLDKFLKKIADLPVVQQMVHEESARTDAEILKARTDCINLVKAMQIPQAVANANLISAEAELKAAEEKVTAFQARFIAAQLSLDAANRACQTAQQSLIHEHGEDCIRRTLSILDTLRSQCTVTIAHLNECSKSEYFSNGQWHFRVVHPVIQQANQQDLDKFSLKLKAIEKSFSAVQLLVMAEVTPDELKTQADALLGAAGYVPDTVKAQP